MAMPDAAGGAVRRREDPRLLKGEGRYTADVRLPNLAYGALVRSPHAHAALRSVGVAEARRAPGVLGVFAAADLAADGIPDIPGGAELKRPDGSPAPKTTRPLLARDRVRHVGEPVAMVVGATLEAALDAAELVAID
jgi:aerobic carbon-monoxide dehydrogenase large subunit